MAEPSFEELAAQLEERARTLEEGNIPLERAIAVYEEGAALVERLRGMLDAAELRVQRLQGAFAEGSAFREEIEPYDELAAPAEPGEGDGLA